MWASTLPVVHDPPAVYDPPVKWQKASSGQGRKLTKRSKLAYITQHQSCDTAALCTATALPK